MFKVTPCQSPISLAKHLESLKASKEFTFIIVRLANRTYNTYTLVVVAI